MSEENLEKGKQEDQSIEGKLQSPSGPWRPAAWHARQEMFQHCSNQVTQTMTPVYGSE